MHLGPRWRVGSAEAVLDPSETTTTAAVAGGPVVVPTDAADSLAWMRADLLARLLPFSEAVAGVWLVLRPAWLGLGPGRLPVQLAFGLAGAALFLAAAALLQRHVARRRGRIRVPVSASGVALQAGDFLLNAPIEEAVFRGLLQGGLGAAAGPAVGLAIGTASYVLYHRLGGWPW